MARVRSTKRNQEGSLSSSAVRPGPGRLEVLELGKRHRTEMKEWEEKGRSILILGAGIAGPALAYWLHRRGFRTTIAEQWKGMRPGGQAIDIRGAALEVVSRMNLMADVAAARTQQKGVTMLDPSGNECWRSTEKTLSAGRLDSGDIEILRDDLTDILFSATQETEYLFNTSIAQWKERNDCVSVTFQNGVTREFSLVIGADGLHSRTRELAFGPPDQFVHHLGMYVGIFTTDNFLHLKDWQVAMWGEAAGMLVYPARANSELRVFLGFGGDALDRRLSIEEQKAMVREKCAELGWETPRLLKAMATAQAFYFGPMAQVRMQHWSKGRVALTGDAAYCPAPNSGQGTSLALVGAYVLGEELARCIAFEDAFAHYETRMRPFVEANQKLALRPPKEPPSDEAINLAKNLICLDPYGTMPRSAARTSLQFAEWEA